MKKILLLLLSFVTLGVHAVELKPRAEIKRMTTSVIVPCVARHFFWLSGMLEAYQNQTIRPDEIVISLSEVEKLDPLHITKLEKGLWDFKLKVIRNNGVIIDGENRTIAMDNANGDILIFSDADDIPHLQRVEIVKYFFENFEVEHIMHSLTFNRAHIVSYAIEDVPILQFASFDQLWNFAQSTAITCGSPCFLKKIGERLKWYGKADVAYNQSVYSLFRDKIVIPLPLILYRNNLTSHGYKVIRAEHT